MKRNQHNNETYLHIKASSSKALSTLKGIIDGVTCDNHLHDLERAKVLEWIDTYSFLRNQPIMSSVFDYLSLALSDGVLTLEESRDIKRMIEVNLESYYDKTTQSIQELHGLLEGIAADNEIKGTEYVHLWDWLNDNEKLKGIFPYDEIYSLVCQIGTKKLITKEQKDKLLTSFSWANNDTIKYDNPLVPWAIDPEIVFSNKLFCMTGISKKMKRNDINSLIREKGGMVANDVTQNLDYLIVCAEANVAWAHACYGRKIETAIKYRRKASNVLIIAEKDLWDVLND